MNSKSMTDFMKPTIITAQQYGIKVSVEIDHSDTDIDELFDAFQTICVGLGYHESAWKQWIIDRADEYNEDDKDIALANGDMGMYEPTPELKKAVENYIANLPKVNEEEENEFFGEYTTKCYCGHTGYCDCGPENEDRYLATEQDEDEFDDYGARIVTDSSFEWGDEPEDDLEFPEPNEELKEGYKKYKKALKTLSAKQKKKSK